MKSKLLCALIALITLSCNLGCSVDGAYAQTSFTLLPTAPTYSTLMRNPADTKNAGVIYLPQVMLDHMMPRHGPNQTPEWAATGRSKFAHKDINGAVNPIALTRMTPWIISALMNGRPDPNSMASQPKIDYDLGFIIGNGNRGPTSTIRVELREASTQVAWVGKLAPGPNVWYIFSAYPRSP
jgi:hypothetical protein